MCRWILGFVFGLVLAASAEAADPFRSDHVLAISDEIIELSEQAIGVWHRVCHAESEYCNIVGLAHPTCQLITWDDTSTSNANGECENKPLPEPVAGDLEIVHCLRGTGTCPGSWGFLAAVIANDQLTESIETQALAILAQTKADIAELVSGYEKFFLTCSVHKTDCATSFGRSYCDGWPKMCLTTGPAVPFPTTTTTTVVGTTTTTLPPGGPEIIGRWGIGFNVISPRLSADICGPRSIPSPGSLIYPAGCEDPVWGPDTRIIVGTHIAPTMITQVCAARVDTATGTIKTGSLGEVSHALRLNGQVVSETLILGTSATEICVPVSIPVVNGDVIQAGRDMIPFGCTITCNPSGGTCQNAAEWCAGIAYGSVFEIYE